MPESRTLNVPNLAVALHDVGREDDAFVAMQESITIRRSLIADRSAISELSQDLAKSLTFISRHLSKSGRHTEGLEAIQEAIKIWRQLSVHLRASFSRELVASYIILDECLENLGFREESIAVKIELIIRFHDLEASKAASPIVPNMEHANPEVSHEVSTLDEVLQKIQNMFERHGFNTTETEEIRQVLEQTGDLHTVADLHEIIQNLVSIMGPVMWSDDLAV